MHLRAPFLKEVDEDPGFSFSHGRCPLGAGVPLPPAVMGGIGIGG